MFRTYDPKRPLIEALRDKSNDLFRILQEICEEDDDFASDVYASMNNVEEMITYIETTRNPEITKMVNKVLEKYYN